MQTACEEKTKQECISVGCVPPAAVAVTDGGCGPGPDPPQLPPWLWAWTIFPSTSPFDVGLDQIHLSFPLRCGPGPDPPQLPPWVWAWTRSPSASPLGVGLDQIPPASPLGVGLDQIPLSFPLGCGPGDPPGNLKGMLEPDPPGPGTPPGTRPPRDQAHPQGPGTPCPWDQAPPVNRITDTLKNITLLQTSFAGGNNNKRQVALQCRGSVNRWFYHSWTFTLFPLFLTDNG